MSSLWSEVVDCLGGACSCSFEHRNRNLHSICTGESGVVLLAPLDELNDALTSGVH